MPLTPDEQARMLEYEAMDAPLVRGGGGLTAEEQARMLSYEGMEAPAAPEPAPEPLWTKPEFEKKLERKFPKAYEAVARVSDVAGSIGKGVGLLGEFVGDIADIPTTVLTEGYEKGIWPSLKRSVMEETPGDIARRRWAAPLAPFAETGLGKDEGPIQQALETGGEWLGGGLGQKARVIAGSVTGAMGGETVGGDIGEIVGGLLGGFKGGGAPALYQAGKRLWEGATGRAKDMMDTIREFTDLGPEELLRRLDIGIDQGRSGSVGQITGDVRLQELEKGLEQSNNPLANQLQDSLKELHSELKADIKGLTPHGANAEQASAYPQERLTDIEAQLQQGLPRAREKLGVDYTEAVDAETADRSGEILGLEQSTAQALEEATQASAPIRSSIDTAEASHPLLAAVTEQAENAKKLEQDAWAKMPKAPQIVTLGIKKDMMDMVDNMEGSARELFTQDHNRVLKAIDSMDLAVTPLQLSSLRSSLRAIVDRTNFDKTSNSANRKILQSMQGRIMQAIESADDGSEAYKHARQATYDYHDIYSKNDLGKAMLDQDPATFASKLITTGDKGAKKVDQLKAVGDSPGLEQSAANYIKAKFEKQTRTNGVFTPAAAQRFMKDHAPVLARYPALKTQLQKAIEAESTALSVGKDNEGLIKSTTKAMDAKVKGLQEAHAAEGEGLTKTMARLQKAGRETPLGRFEKGVTDDASAKAGVAAIVEGDRPIESMDELVTALKTAPDTQALDNVEAAVNEYMVEKIMTKPGEFSKETEARFNAMKEKLRPVMGDKLDRVSELIDEYKRSALPPGRKGIRVTEPSRTAHMLSRMVGTAAGAFLTKSLWGIGAGRAVTGELFLRKPSEKRMKLLTELLTNPEKFRDGLNAIEAAGTQAEADKWMRKWLERTPVQVHRVLTEEEEE